ncbi:pyridoxal phosphate-dependent aminotransferase [Algisphaera agarilytica]|uniref:Histidinol-phosphate aminotransferase n=1 Tax=Algisphaera agarilytica TaxID=1385975 RepID=A0A7X0H3D8_9BACT|nr:aminotransferase class I/II-fold pyridoxal phosphate-dependent enzyme [Algisphaera agarilytica]MBB6428332.1 histidinol-phosphate aminotransferase [Algisphaera agarilytica]
MPYERSNIQKLHAYVPGEQPGYRETLGGGDFGEGIVKLNTNENPYPPSDSVMEAIRGLSPEALRLYPPADAAEFRQVAGELHGLSAQHVIATNGGDELLRMLITVFCDPLTPKPRAAEPPPGGEKAPDTSRSVGGGIGMTDPSYTLYPVLANIQDTPVTVVQRTGEDFKLPADYADQLNAAGCQLGFIVNPHAPTGQLESLDTLRQLANEFAGILVIDEAYTDFAPHNALPLLQEGIENVVILRSLSKGYSLAGLRYGYGLASPAIIEALDKARDSYNTDILSQAAATAALRDQEYAKSTWDRTVAERTRLTTALLERGFTVPESHTNFILAQVPKPRAEQSEAPDQAKTIYETLKQQNILIRYFSKPGLTDKLRITVGTPEQNDKLLAILDSISP